MIEPKVLSKGKICLLILAISVITAIVLWPVRSNDYINFDDTKYLIYNPAVKELSFDSVKKIFTAFKGGQYHYVPLTILSFAVEFKFFDLSPAVYHADNLILHIFNTILTFCLLYGLFKNWRVAGIGALLFGIHPMHVQSVAWVVERKDLLYSFFYLLGLIYYVRFHNNPANRHRLIVLLFFLLSLLSKPMAVTFPIILLCIDYFLKRKMTFRNIFEKWPFFFLSGLFSYITSFEKNFPVIEFEKGYSWFERFLIASFNFLQFIIKAVFPVNLSVYYPLPSRVNGLPDPFYWAPFFVGAGIILFFIYLRHNRAFIFGAMFFCASIFLVLNFIPMGNLLTADHYSYLSYIGLFIILGCGFERMITSPRFSKGFKMILIVALCGYMMELAIKSYKRCFVWSNSETFWCEVIDRYPHDPFAYYNLADYFVRTQRINKAIQEYSNALKADPQYFAAYNNRGNMYFILGKEDLALNDYKKALELYPAYILVYENIGELFMRQKRYEEAFDIYTRALEIAPDNSLVINRLKELENLR